MSDIIENNKLIAEFMGLIYIPHSDDAEYKPGYWKSRVRKDDNSKLNSYLFICRHHKSLGYRRSWDWLMPVLNKIETMPIRSTVNGVAISIGLSSTNKKYCYIKYGKIFDQRGRKISEKYYFSGTFENETALKAAYEAVVAFINWYNKNK